MVALCRLLCRGTRENHEKIVRMDSVSAEIGTEHLPEYWSEILPLRKPVRYVRYCDMHHLISQYFT
jgi:hypothetical protein